MPNSYPIHNPDHIPPRTLILATANPHKVGELRAMLQMQSVSVIGLGDLPAPFPLVEPPEPGRTFTDNARLKARGYAQQIAAIPGVDASCLLLADDSGIEIDALALPDGTPRPGVISSHYSSNGEERGLSRDQRDAANNQLVLQQLLHIPPAQRSARFVCVMCVVDLAGRILFESRGTFEGQIGQPPRVPSGTHGFGYDPLFLVAPDFRQTSAELDPELKNRLSHRAQAAEQVRAWFQAR